MGRVARYAKCLWNVFKFLFQIIWSRIHLYNTNNQSRIRVLVPRNPAVMIEYTNYCDQEQTKQINYPPVISTRRSVILGTCDGLLCLLLTGVRGQYSTIAVYNPSTGKYFRVHLSPMIKKYGYSISCSWFGRHPSSGEYVLVLGNLYTEVGVYKFTRSGLKSIHYISCRIRPEAPASLVDERGVLLRGAVHWPARWINRRDRSLSRHVICAYHLEGNEYSEISPPVQCYFKLGVVEGCLFAIFKANNGEGCEFEMWVMKEYGVEQSWAKYANIEGLDCYRVSPLGFFPNGDLILDVDNLKLMKYRFKDSEAVLLMNHDTGGEAIMCADSLVSPVIYSLRKRRRLALAIIGAIFGLFWSLISLVYTIYLYVWFFKTYFPH